MNKRQRKKQYTMYGNQIEKLIRRGKLKITLISPESQITFDSKNVAKDIVEKTFVYNSETFRFEVYESKGDSHEAKKD